MDWHTVLTAAETIAQRSIVHAGSSWLPVAAECCRLPGESDGHLGQRLVLAGWAPRVVCEALTPSSASLMRSQAGTISREIKKLGSGPGQPPPDWDAVAAALWRFVDRWISDSTKDSSFFDRLWKKLALQDSLKEEIRTGSVGGGIPAVMPQATMAELRAAFPDASPQFLKRLRGSKTGGSFRPPGSPGASSTSRRTGSSRTSSSRSKLRKGSSRTGSPGTRPNGSSSGGKS